jgi:uncharacterized oxidoreductase
LDDVKKVYPSLHIYRSDVAQKLDRIELFEAVTHDFPNLNELLNNAGIAQQHRHDNVKGWPSERAVIETNLIASIHLSQLFARHLSK